MEKFGKTNGTRIEPGSAAKYSSYAPRGGKSEMFAADGTHSNHALKRRRAWSKWKTLTRRAQSGREA